MGVANWSTGHLSERFPVMARHALSATTVGGLAPEITRSANVLGASPARDTRIVRPEITDLRRGMIGFVLAHEQFTVPDLVRNGALASQAGFQLLATSDHLQPWQANEAHSGEAWVTIGAMGAQAPAVWMGTSVTCPTMRYNPAVVAEAFATLSQLYPGRVFLGVGSGEALNEQAATGTLAGLADAVGPVDRSDFGDPKTMDRRTGGA